MEKAIHPIFGRIQIKTTMKTTPFVYDILKFREIIGILTECTDQNDMFRRHEEEDDRK